VEGLRKLFVRLGLASRLGVETEIRGGIGNSKLESGLIAHMLAVDFLCYPVLLNNLGAGLYEPGL
jgi:hypothetical protein